MTGARSLNPRSQEEADQLHAQLLEETYRNQLAALQHLLRRPEAGQEPLLPDLDTADETASQDSQEEDRTRVPLPRSAFLLFLYSDPSLPSFCKHKIVKFCDTFSVERHVCSALLSMLNAHQPECTPQTT